MPFTCPFDHASPTKVLFMALAFTRLLWPQPADAAEAVSASTRQAADVVVSLLASEDADLLAVALDAIRYGVKGGWVTRMMADKLPSLPPSRQAALLLALADRGDVEALTAGQAAASSRSGSSSA